MANIGTEDAIKKAVEDQAIAGHVAALVTIVHSQGKLIGLLQGAIIVGLVVLAFLMFALDSKIQTNEVLIHRLIGEAR